MHDDDRCQMTLDAAAPTAVEDKENGAIAGPLSQPAGKRQGRGERGVGAKRTKPEADGNAPAHAKNGAAWIGVGAGAVAGPIAASLSGDAPGPSKKTKKSALTPSNPRPKQQLSIQAFLKPKVETPVGVRCEPASGPQAPPAEPALFPAAPGPLAPPPLAPPPRHVAAPAAPAPHARTGVNEKAFDSPPPASLPAPSRSPSPTKGPAPATLQGGSLPPALLPPRGPESTIGPKSLQTALSDQISGWRGPEDEQGKDLFFAYRSFVGGLGGADRELYVEVDALELLPTELVKKSVRIFWPTDEGWYLGTVTSYSPASMRHRVEHTDGEVVEYLLANERVCVAIDVGQVLRPADEAYVRRLQSELERLHRIVQLRRREQAVLKKLGKGAAAAGHPGFLAEDIEALGFPEGTTYPSLAAQLAAVDPEDLDSVNFSAGRLAERIQTAQRILARLEEGRQAPAPPLLPPGLANTAVPVAMGTDAALGSRVSYPLMPGEVVWCTVRGNPAWPAVVVSEAEGRRRGMKGGSSTSAPCIFFGAQANPKTGGRMLEWGRFTPGKDLCRFAEGLKGGRHRMAEKSFKNAAAFKRALSEASSFLKEGTGSLPSWMVTDWNDEWAYEEDEEGEEEAAAVVAAARKAGSEFPRTVQPGVQLVSPGRIEFVHPSFCDEKQIYPVDYKLRRMHPNLLAPASDKAVPHELEILYSDDGPRFRITVQGRAFEGATPSLAWSAYELQGLAAGGKMAKGQAAKTQQAAAMAKGPKMFGLENNAVRLAIQQLPGAGHLVRFTDWVGEAPPVPPLTNEERAALLARRAQLLRLPRGVTEVRYPVHTGRCHVCDLDEEAEWNEMIVCASPTCRVMVHQGCYGIEKVPRSDELWLCDPCTLGAEPPCELCPVKGGALKPTDNGRWCHLACAQWMPGLTIVSSDAGLSGPIMGCIRVDPDRRSLKCSVCSNPGNIHGACIQCNGDWNCYKSFHVLCARSAGYLMEQIEEKNNVVPGPALGKKDKERDEKKTKKKRVDGTDFGNGLVLKCYCPAHRHAAITKAWGRNPNTAARRLGSPLCSPTKPLKSVKGPKAAHAPAAGGAPAAAKSRRSLVIDPPAEQGYQLPPAPLGFASRTEPVNLEARRGSKAPDAIAAAEEKRKFIKGLPYEAKVFGGRVGRSFPPPSRCIQFDDASALHSWAADLPGDAAGDDRAAAAALASTPSALPGAPTVLSVGASYREMMRRSYSRVAFGKSAIHGWGGFAKQDFQPGDMILEYAGELLRPPIADLREQRLYNDQVGAGTYVFTVDDHFLVDATWAGNMTHILNHSCDPNCYSRVVAIEGTNHVIIFAGRNGVKRGEELTYNYRFGGTDMQLSCNCGAANCRGRVNYEAQEAPGVKLPDGHLRLAVSAAALRAALAGLANRGGSSDSDDE